MFYPGAAPPPGAEEEGGDSDPLLASANEVVDDAPPLRRRCFGFPWRVVICLLACVLVSVVVVLLTLSQHETQQEKEFTQQKENEITWPALLIDRIGGTGLSPQHVQLLRQAMQCWTIGQWKQLHPSTSSSVSGASAGSSASSSSFSSRVGRLYRRFVGESPALCLGRHWLNNRSSYSSEEKNSGRRLGGEEDGRVEDGSESAISLSYEWQPIGHDLSPICFVNMNRGSLAATPWHSVEPPSSSLSSHPSSLSNNSSDTVFCNAAAMTSSAFADVGRRMLVPGCSSLLPFATPPSRAAFCRVLHGRHILILGDSLSLQFFDQLYSTLANSRAPQPGIVCDGFQHRIDNENKDDDDNDDADDGDVSSPIRPLTIMFKRNDHLMPTTVEVHDFAENVHMWPFVDDVTISPRSASHVASNTSSTSTSGSDVDGSQVETVAHHPAPDIVILNRGAHWVNDSRFEQELRSTMTWLRQQLPHALLVYRTTVPGHPNCMQHNQPLPAFKHNNSFSPSFNQQLKQTQSSPASSSKFSSSPLPWIRVTWDDYFASAPYNWDSLLHQNSIASSIISSVGVDGVMLDVAAHSQYRGDSHRAADDCLHYCSPGPVDSWIIHLYSMLSAAHHLRQQQQLQNSSPIHVR